MEKELYYISEDIKVSGRSHGLVANIYGCKNLSLRIDDTQNLSFWAEIEFTKEQLERWLKTLKENDV